MAEEEAMKDYLLEGGVVVGIEESPPKGGPGQHPHPPPNVEALQLVRVGLCGSFGKKRVAWIRFRGGVTIILPPSKEGERVSLTLSSLSLKTTSFSIHLLVASSHLPSAPKGQILPCQSSNLRTR
jgi:hypothetical protein